MGKCMLFLYGYVFICAHVCRCFCMFMYEYMWRPQEKLMYYPQEAFPFGNSHLLEDYQIQHSF